MALGIGQTLRSEKDIDVVGDFGEVAAATAELEQLDPQVALMSVDLREMSGFQACARVVAQLPTARVIMMSWTLSDDEAADAVRAGAADYISKDIAPCDLVQAVRGDGQG